MRAPRCPAPAYFGAGASLVLLWCCCGVPVELHGSGSALVLLWCYCGGSVVLHGSGSYICGCQRTCEIFQILYRMIFFWDGGLVHRMVGTSGMVFNSAMVASSGMVVTSGTVATSGKGDRSCN